MPAAMGARRSLLDAQVRLVVIRLSPCFETGHALSSFLL